MTREDKEAIIRRLEAMYGEAEDNETKEALFYAIEALTDNKPSRTWIAKNEYRRGWHDAITRALSEVLKIHVGNEIFDMVQKETLIGLGLSMDSALGAEPYSETEESYPEPDRPHGEWEALGFQQGYAFCRCSNCHKTTRLYRDSKNEFCCIADIRKKVVSCIYCGADMRKEW